MSVAHAHRLDQLPPYLFVQIDRSKREAIAAGRDVIDFGVGDPDRPTPEFILKAMEEAIHRPTNHRYAPGAGIPEFRRAASEYMSRRFQVDLDVDRDVISVIGSKEGIGHLPTAIINPGDAVLIPEPGYPVYASGTIFAGGTCHTMPLTHDRDWLPSFGDIPVDMRRKTRLMYLNYPNNPTGACCTLSFLEEAVKFAREHDLIIAHDAAYCETWFDQPPPSILQVRGAKEVAIEFHSLSKTFNMTGWRLGFAAGNPDVLAALLKVKNNLDSGAFGAVQQAGAVALNNVDHPDLRAQRDMYRTRRDALIGGLREAGWSADAPMATFYAWVACPPNWSSMKTTTRLLQDANVVAIPGEGFGPCGAGYIRFALTVDLERIREAVRRIARLSW